MTGLAALLLITASADDPVDPPRPGKPEDSILDWSALEASSYASAVTFSADYESDPQAGFGLLLRAPSPWLSRQLLGSSSDDVGFFVDFRASQIDRNLEPAPDDSEGTLTFLALGIDCALHRDGTFMLAGQVGIQLGLFGGVADLHDGVALLVGLAGGVEIAPGVTLAYMPQWAIADAGDSILFNSVGLQVRF